MKYSCSITVICLHLFALILGDRCCHIENRDPPVYKLTKEKSRSTVSVIARKEVTNVEKCEEFAVSKRALAFNYREALTGSYRRRDHWTDSNCQVLECPEINGFSGLVNDTRFNYYSIYRTRISSDFLKNGTLKCVPRVGVFVISKDYLNYTDAQSSCKKLRGNLAHIVSEARTEGLGNLVGVSAFVGLSNRDKERLWKNEFDEPLSCFDYRGWAPNEPAHSRGCVVLSSPEKPHFSPAWKVSPCSRKFPYVCEIFPRSRPTSHQKRPKN